MQPLLQLLARAALWRVVAELLRGLPKPVLIVVGLVAAGVFVLSR